MMPAVMAYTIAVSFLAALAGYALDRAGPLKEGSKRWIWAAAMLLSLAYPAAVLLRPPPMANPVSAVASSGMAGSASDATKVLNGTPGATAFKARAPLSQGSIGGRGRWEPEAVLNIPLMILWVVSSFGLALWLCVGRAALYRRALAWAEERVDGHAVRISEDTGPAVVGPWGSFIVLPRWLLRAPHELRAMVLRHEAQHLAAGDPALVLFGLIFVVLTPWNLPLWWQLRRLRFALEVDCDARVRSDGADLNAYARMLLAVCEHNSRIPVGVLAMSARRSDLEQRVTALLVRASRPRSVSAATIAASALVVVSAAELPAPQLRAPAIAPGKALPDRPLSLAACEPTFSRSQDPNPQTFKCTGVIEDIVSNDEGPYRSTAYVVNFYGTRILVFDGFNLRDKSVRDDINFIASESRITPARDRSQLSFYRDDWPSHPISGALLGQASTTQTTGVVEEVFRAKRGDYWSVAYIARIGNERVPVWDELALSHYAIGDVIPISESRSTTEMGSSLVFRIDDRRLPEYRNYWSMEKAAAASAKVASGIVEQTLAAESEGYTYRAYVVSWRGSDILINDPTASSNYQVGDRITFRVLRVTGTGPNGAGGFMKLELQTPQGQVADGGVPSRTLSVPDSAVVERVLSSQEGATRSVAYLVRWDGVPVAISDPFGTTHFEPGQRITFRVERANYAGGKHLQLILGHLAL
jgi:beta-lactamase regulating signal transducer with metallopeptidase domain